MAEGIPTIDLSVDEIPSIDLGPLPDGGGLSAGSMPSIDLTADEIPSIDLEPQQPEGETPWWIRMPTNIGRNMGGRALETAINLGAEGVRDTYGQIPFVGGAFEQAADRVSQMTAGMNQARTEANQADAAEAGWLENRVTGVGTSLGEALAIGGTVYATKGRSLLPAARSAISMMALPLYGGATAANDSWYEAKREGKSDEEAASYAGWSGIIESAFTFAGGVFGAPLSRIGAGMLRREAAKEAADQLVKAGVKESIKGVAKSAGKESVEEVLTDVAHMFNESVHGIESDESLGMRLLNTAVEGGLGGAAGAGIQRLAERLDVAQTSVEEVYQAFGDAKEFATRKAQEAGLSLDVEADAAYEAAGTAARGATTAARAAVDAVQAAAPAVKDAAMPVLETTRKAFEEMTGLSRTSKSYREAFKKGYDLSVQEMNEANAVMDEAANEDADAAPSELEESFEGRTQVLPLDDAIKSLQRSGMPNESVEAIRDLGQFDAMYASEIVRLADQEYSEQQADIESLRAKYNEAIETIAGTQQSNPGGKGRLQQKINKAEDADRIPGFDELAEHIEKYAPELLQFQREQPGLEEATRDELLFNMLKAGKAQFVDVDRNEIAGRVYDQALESARQRGFVPAWERPEGEAVAVAEQSADAENLIPFEPVGPIRDRIRRPEPSPIPVVASPSEGFSPKAIARKVRAEFKRQFSSSGELPREVFDMILNKDHAIASHLRQMTRRVNALHDRLHTRYGDAEAVTENTRLVLNAALAGNENAIRQLPKDIAVAVGEMRNHIDSLSQEFIDAGIAQGELEVRFDENMGTYVNRAYRIYTDPRWADKIDPHHYNKAVNWFRKNYSAYDFPEIDAEGRPVDPQATFIEERTPEVDSPEQQVDHTKELTESQARNLVDGILADKTTAGQYMRSLIVGSKDTSVLKKREDIPLAIRNLYGQHRDPVRNYTATVSKMAKLLENHRFLTELKSKGQGRYLFAGDDLDRPNDLFNTPIDPQGNAGLSPLAGWRTTPEIAQGLQDFYKVEQAPKWLSLYMKAVLATKIGKTVGSEITQIRNFYAGLEFAMANNNWNAKAASRAASAMKQDIRESLPSGLRKRIKDNPEAEAYLTEMTEKRLLGESPHAGEIRNAERGAYGMDPFAYETMRQDSLLRQVGRVGQRFYQAGDNFWKVYGIESEVDKYADAYEKAGVAKDRDDLKAAAEQRVRDTVPTYSEIPRAIRSLSRFPMLASFPSFASEYYRTKVKAIQLAVREMNDPILHDIGVARLRGQFMATIMLPLMISSITAMLFGVSGEEDEAIREFAPEWEKNSNYFYWRARDGKATYFDLSYLLPSAHFLKPLGALFREAGKEGVTEGAIAMAGEAAGPFASLDILTKSLIEAITNKKFGGGEVANESDHSQLLQRLNHVLEGTRPGIINQMDRAAMAATGEVSDTGQSYGMGSELFAATSGMRASVREVPEAVKWRAREYNRVSRSDTQLFTSVAGSQGTTSASEVYNAYMQQDEAARATFRRMHRAVEAGISLGEQPESIYTTLRANGIGEDRARQVMAGVYVPYTASRSVVAKILGSPNGRERFDAYARARQEVIERDGSN